VGLISQALAVTAMGPDGRQSGQPKENTHAGGLTTSSSCNVFG